MTADSLNHQLRATIATALTDADGVLQRLAALPPSGDGVRYACSALHEVEQARLIFERLSRLLAGIAVVDGRVSIAQVAAAMGTDQTTVTAFGHEYALGQQLRSRSVAELQAAIPEHAYSLRAALAVVEEHRWDPTDTALVLSLETAGEWALGQSNDSGDAYAQALAAARSMAALIADGVGVTWVGTRLAEPVSPDILGQLD